MLFKDAHSTMHPMVEDCMGFTEYAHSKTRPLGTERLLQYLQVIEIRVDKLRGRVVARYAENLCWTRSSSGRVGVMSQGSQR
jgi:hypothetical protein